MEKILVFGHKNPDTDTICSSLVKSILEKKKNNKEVIAARLGNVNKETLVSSTNTNQASPF